MLHSSTGRPKTFFREDERSTWEPQLRLLASRGLRDNDIAHYFGCSAQLMKGIEEVIGIIRHEKAAYRFRIEDELYRIATIPDTDFVLYEDPVERAEMRKQKMKALTVLHNVLHKDPFVPPAEGERLRRLSDEDLKLELEKALAK
jgi:hypothetical protein